MNKKKEIFLSGTGFHTRNEKGEFEESMFNVTFKNINTNVSFYVDMNQIHLNLFRDELILLKKAIEEKLTK